MDICDKSKAFRKRSIWHAVLAPVSLFSTSQRLLVHISQSASVKVSAEASEEALGSAGGSASQVDPTSADQAEDQLAAPRAAEELKDDGDELQQVCNPGPNPKYASVKDPPTSTKPSLFI